MKSPLSTQYKNYLLGYRNHREREIVKLSVICHSFNGLIMAPVIFLNHDAAVNALQELQSKAMDTDKFELFEIEV